MERMSALRGSLTILYIPALLAGQRLSFSRESIFINGILEIELHFMLERERMLLPIAKYDC